MKPLHEIPGHKELGQYIVSNSGIHLFKAYIERRNADKAGEDKRTKELRDRLGEIGAQNGMPTGAFEEVITELLRIQILDALDTIIEDILYFCEHPVDCNDKLADIRRALRINDGRALNDIETAAKKTEVISAWWGIVGEMTNTGWRSQNTNARLVASKTGIGYRRAIDLWLEHLKSEPWMKRHLSEIEWPSKRPGKASKPARKPSPIKRKKLDFGKGRATR